MFRFIAPIALKIDLRVLGPVWSSQNPDQIQSRYVNNRPNVGLLIGLRLWLVKDVPLLTASLVLYAY